MKEGIQDRRVTGKEGKGLEGFKAGMIQDKRDA